MKGYYDQKLFAHQLQKVYEIASSRVRQYLEEEIRFVVKRISRQDRVLELGCGYGRILGPMADSAKIAVGVDTSFHSLELAASACARFHLAAMNAGKLGFKNHAFHLTACVQNGISAFHMDPEKLMKEAIRVTRPGGRVLFSTYTSEFWPHRLQWFKDQARHGLLGEIDEAASKNGTIVCKDGFKAVTFTKEDLLKTTRRLHLRAEFHVVDGSSLFCEIMV
jgi:2-polyprenyl-6-hydroxyphenyl methylase/3-demethylubiquinone-9 3-methyltransferase